MVCGFLPWVWSRVPWVEVVPFTSIGKAKETWKEWVGFWMSWLWVPGAAVFSLTSCVDYSLGKRQGWRLGNQWQTEVKAVGSRWDQGECEELKKKRKRIGGQHCQSMWKWMLEGQAEAKDLEMEPWETLLSCHIIGLLNFGHSMRPYKIKSRP